MVTDSYKSVLDKTDKQPCYLCSINKYDLKLNWSKWFKFYYIKINLFLIH